MDDWRDRDGWRSRLAQWFAPTLVIAAEFTSPKKSKVHGAPEQDYHPRDIRLVLRAVNDRPKQKGGVVIDFLPRSWPLRKLLGDIWGPFSALETFARSWPRQILVLSAIIAAGWLGILSYALIDRPSLLFHWHWYVIAGTYGLLMAFALLGANLAIWHVPPTRWHIAPLPWLFVFAVTFATVPLAIGVCWQFPSLGPRAAASSLMLVSAAYLVLPLFSLRHRTNPLKLLARLQAIAEADTDQVISVSLRYIQAGPPNDPVSHRRRYWKLLERSRSEPASDYPPTAYARVVTGTGQNQDLFAVQYWFAYYYDDWANKHEMDWEQVTVFVRAPHGVREPAPTDVQPLACGFGGHHLGCVARWEEKVEKRERKHQDGTLCGISPVVYVARGSHANYPRPGRYLPAISVGGLRFTGRDVGLLTGRSADSYVDIALPAPAGGETPASAVLAVDCSSPPQPRAGGHDGAASQAKPGDEALRVVTLPEDPPGGRPWPAHDPNDHDCYKDGRDVCIWDFRWLNLRGLWGAPGRILGGDDAPRSPAQQEPWTDPFFWLEQCDPFYPSFGRTVLDKPPTEQQASPASPAATP